MDFEFEIPSLQTNQRYAACNFNNENRNDPNNLNLQQQAMLNQFVSIAGCSFEQAFYLLSASNWQYQVALNSFFDEVKEGGVNTNRTFNNGNNTHNLINNSSANAPSNTPVTPPDVDFLEKAFSQMNPKFQENSTFSHQNVSVINNQRMNSFMDQNLDRDMKCLNQRQQITEAEYLASARFNYYHN